jgi:hypothetical protein
VYAQKSQSLTYVPIDKRGTCSKMVTRSTLGQKGVSVMENIRVLLGDPSAVKTPKFLTTVQRSKVLALGWTAMRVWLGIMWLQAAPQSYGEPRIPRSFTTTGPE